MGLILAARRAGIYPAIAPKTTNITAVLMLAKPKFERCTTFPSFITKVEIP